MMWMIVTELCTEDRNDTDANGDDADSVTTPMIVEGSTQPI